MQIRCRDILFFVSILLMHGCGNRVDIDAQKLDEKKDIEAVLQKKLKKQSEQMVLATKCLDKEVLSQVNLLTNFTTNNNFDEFFKAEGEYKFYLLKGNVLVLANSIDTKLKKKSFSKKCEFEAIGDIEIKKDKEGLIDKIEIKNDKKSCENYAHFGKLFYMLERQLTKGGKITFKKKVGDCKK